MVGNRAGPLIALLRQMRVTRYKKKTPRYALKKYVIVKQERGSVKLYEMVTASDLLTHASPRFPN